MEPLGIPATASFTVRPNLPAELEPLRDLAANLRWSYDRPTQELFARVDPQAWATGTRDPARLLAGADQSHLADLARDARYRDAMRTAVQSLEGTLDARSDDSLGHDGLVAYFSPEFGITEAIGGYSGGLGVLAGDHLKAAGEMGLKLVAVGLFYRHGYFHQQLSPDGWQSERYVDNDPHTMALTELDTTVEVELAGLTAELRIWKAMLGPTPIYLLDADLPDNDPSLRVLTDRLYGGDVEHRLRQEIVLGVGGVRALTALGEPVEVFHTNEGHAGFMGLERIRSLMVSDGLSLETALEVVRSSSVFTTHTPVPAGMERFGRPLMERYFSNWTRECGMRIEDLMALGHPPGERTDNPFNMAVMGMRLSGFRNGVSRTHGSTSRSMFEALWPGVPTDEVPIGHITNGVHPHTWLSPAMQALIQPAVGIPGSGPPDWSAVHDLTDAQLDAAALEDRAHLVALARRRMRDAALASGRSPSELSWIDHALDPEVPTICFARRMATHKRAALLLEQPDRLRALLRDTSMPVQFVFAGKAHTGDDDGKEMIRRLVAFANEPEVRGRFVFLEDYDMAIARAMVQGADVWLNTPQHPLEASGTSGMKAALNGALNLSVLDGWWAEGFDPGSGPGGVPNGWAIAAPVPDGSDGSPREPAAQARLDCETLYELIENQVLPLAHSRSGRSRDPYLQPPGGSWWDRVRHSLASLGPLVDAHRMTGDYSRSMYAPAVTRSRRLIADGYAGATELAVFLERVHDVWGSVHVQSVDVDESVGDLGSQRRVTASVDTGDLTPGEVEVQLLVGHLGPGGTLESPEIVSMTPVGASAVLEHPGYPGVTYEGTAHLSVPGRMGLTVRVVPDHELLSSSLEAGLVTWAH